MKGRPLKGALVPGPGLHHHAPVSPGLVIGKPSVPPDPLLPELLARFRKLAAPYESWIYYSKGINPIHYPGVPESNYRQRHCLRNLNHRGQEKDEKD